METVLRHLIQVVERAASDLWEYSKMMKEDFSRRKVSTLLKGSRSHCNLEPKASQLGYVSSSDELKRESR